MSMITLPSRPDEREWTLVLDGTSQLPLHARAEFEEDDDDLYGDDDDLGELEDDDLDVDELEDDDFDTDLDV